MRREVIDFASVVIPVESFAKNIFKGSLDYIFLEVNAAVFQEALDAVGVPDLGKAVDVLNVNT